MTVVNKKKLLDFLISRWSALVSLGAIERVYNASTRYCIENKIPKPHKPSELMCQPEAQLEIIKKTIASILPEAKFVDYSYESPVPLNTDDFVELYLEDHQQCIEKLTETMSMKKIS